MLLFGQFVTDQWPIWEKHWRKACFRPGVHYWNLRVFDASWFCRVRCVQHSHLNL